MSEMTRRKFLSGVAARSVLAALGFKARAALWGELPGSAAACPHVPVKSFKTKVVSMGSFDWIEFPRELSVRAFFHEETDAKHVIWGCAQNVVSNSIVIFKSTNYFETGGEVVSELPMSHPFRPESRFFYRDIFGNGFILGHPSPLILTPDGCWQQLGFHFNGDECTFHHGWNVTERARDKRLVFTEYSYVNGDQSNDPWRAHGIFTSLDPRRIGHWDCHNLTPLGSCFRHIHGLHFNPYKDKIQLLFLGDLDDKRAEPKKECYGVGPGMYLIDESTADHPKRIELNDIEAPKKACVPKEGWNGPCHVTWWPDGRAFIASDNIGGWFAELGGDWSWGNLKLRPHFWLCEQEGLELATPWSTVALRDKKETYCSAWQLGSSTTAVLRYDPARKEVKRLFDSQAQSDVATHVYLSTSRNNLLPSNTRYVFCGGDDYRAVRIPTLSNV